MAIAVTTGDQPFTEIPDITVCHFWSPKKRSIHAKTRLLKSYFENS